MTIKDKATKYALSAARMRGLPNSPKGDWSIYRVGGAWMYTSETFEQTQEKYKVPVKDFTKIA